jgi:hypothetical protein
MRQEQRFARGAALVCSIVLVGLYVYDRAGGDIFRRNPSPLIPVGETEDPALLPGSKSAGVWPSASRTVRNEPSTIGTPENVPAPILLPGSQSAMIVDLPDVGHPRTNDAVATHTTASPVLDPFESAPSEEVSPANDDPFAAPEEIPTESGDTSVAEDDPFNPQ